VLLLTGVFDRDVVPQFLPALAVTCLLVLAGNRGHRLPGSGPAAGQLREDGAAGAGAEQQLRDDGAAGAGAEQQLRDDGAAGAGAEQQLRDDVAARTLFSAATPALRCCCRSNSGTA
jgi:hypothetical protein